MGVKKPAVGGLRFVTMGGLTSRGHTMGALHFLEHGFLLDDHVTNGLQHELELFETGGKLFLRLWVGGIGANMPVECCLTQAQADQLAEGAQYLASRIGLQ